MECRNGGRKIYKRGKIFVFTVLFPNSVHTLFGTFHISIYIATFTSGQGGYSSARLEDSSISPHSAYIFVICYTMTSRSAPSYLKPGATPMLACEPHQISFTDVPMLRLSLRQPLPAFASLRQSPPVVSARSFVPQLAELIYVLLAPS